MVYRRELTGTPRMAVVRDRESVGAMTVATFQQATFIEVRGKL
jgi:hypothetical protein